jgi:hypothetical protein
MANNGLVADDVRVRNMRETLLEEMDLNLSFPNRSVFTDHPADEGNYGHSGVVRRKDTHQELDEIHTERARYLLNIDDDLIELLR